MGSGVEGNDFMGLETAKLSRPFFFQNLQEHIHYFRIKLTALVALQLILGGSQVQRCPVGTFRPHGIEGISNNDYLLGQGKSVAVETIGKLLSTG